MINNEIDALKLELDFWKDISNKGYLIRQKEDGSWYVEAAGVILPVAYPSQQEAVEVTKRIIKAKSKTSYKATILYNEGYGKQCFDVEPFEAESKETAQILANGISEQLFGDNPKTDIIEVKIKRQR